MTEAGTMLRKAGEPGRTVADQELLERFVRTRDEAAFSQLVHRYAKAILAVCRRVLHQEQDVEDAFQAVLLVLARRAASIRKGEAVGSWLYGVAYRTAMRARKRAIRQQERDRHAAGPYDPEPPWSQAAAREFQRLLDEEVQRLAQKFRAPFILCCLEGLSNHEAARELGWREGTVSGRLAQARKLLQKRLARRGIMLTAALTAVALTQPTAAAAAPGLLTPGIIQATLAQAAGQPAAGLSPTAVSLAKGLLHGMCTAHLKTIGILFGLVIASGWGSLFAWQWSAEGPPPAVAPAGQAPNLPPLVVPAEPD